MHRYLHLGMTATAEVFAPARVDATWALLRLRHPLLASTVEMAPGDYSNASFVCVHSAVNGIHLPTFIIAYLLLVHLCQVLATF